MLLHPGSVPLWQGHTTHIVALGAWENSFRGSGRKNSLPLGAVKNSKSSEFPRQTHDIKKCDGSILWNRKFPEIPCTGIVEERTPRRATRLRTTEAGKNLCRGGRTAAPQACILDAGSQVQGEWWCMDYTRANKEPPAGAQSVECRETCICGLGLTTGVSSPQRHVANTSCDHGQLAIANVECRETQPQWEQSHWEPMGDCRGREAVIVCRVAYVCSDLLWWMSWPRS